MALIEVNWNPKEKDLRSFGWIGLVACCILAGLLYLLKGLAIKWICAIIALGLVIFISSLVCLKVTRLIYIGLTAVTLPIGMAVSFVILTLFFYLIITPVGLVFRLIGRDSMNRKFDSNVDSYWVKHRPTRKRERYFHQF